MRKQYSNICSHSPLEDIFYFSDEFTLSCDQLSDSDEIQTASFSKAQLKPDCDDFLINQPLQQSCLVDNNFKLFNQSRTFKQTSLLPDEESHQETKAVKSMEKSYLKNLREEMEIEEEFASIFDPRRQQTICSATTGDNQTDSFNDQSLQNEKQNFFCSASIDQNSNESNSQSSGDFLKDTTQSVIDQNSNENIGNEPRFMIPSQSKYASSLRQPQPIRGSLVNQGRKFSPIQKTNLIQRPTNPMMQDLAFTRVNSENTLIERQRAQLGDNFSLKYQQYQENSSNSLKLRPSENNMYY